MEHPSQIWSVDLNHLWEGVGLPSIYVEKKFNPAGFSEARAAVSRNDLQGGAWVNLDEPVLLQTHREPKPWGAEVWFTGIEKRGICSVETKSGQSLSLPVFLAMQAGKESQVPTPPLLKILDPFAERSRGSLYIEVHEKKWETYIVTAVDSKLYPDGQGELLFGFSSEKLKSFADDESLFRTSLLRDVRAYEVHRRILDGERQPESPANLKDISVKAEEAWQTVKSYFNMRKVVVGDVLQVPPFTPHSLQAGVKVVEFQTPTYERLILAFNQKVLTQSHWDSERAIQLASFDTPAPVPAEFGNGWQLIVSFPEFDVERCLLETGDSVAVASSKNSVHRLVFVILGEIAICTRDGRRIMRVEHGQAVLLPAHLVGHALTLTNVGQSKAGCLLV